MRKCRGVGGCRPVGCSPLPEFLFLLAHLMEFFLCVSARFFFLYGCEVENEE